MLFFLLSLSVSAFFALALRFPYLILPSFFVVFFFPFLYVLRFLTSVAFSPFIVLNSYLSSPVFLFIVSPPVYSLIYLTGSFNHRRVPILRLKHSRCAAEANKFQSQWCHDTILA